MSLKCKICKLDKDKSEVITLMCTHTFCWSCIESYLKSNLTSKNKCPDASCQDFMKDKEVRKILTDFDIQRYEDICTQNIPNSHICILPECGAVSVYDNFNIQFDCPKCTAYNCVNCKLAHKYMSCGDVLDRNGKSLELVCKEEMDRARDVLQKKNAESMRSSIINMEKLILVPNPCIFTCDICCKDIGKNNGIILRKCFHQICRDCMREHVKNATSIPVPCPFAPCPSYFDDRECREILTKDDNALFENKSITRASKGFQRPDRCRQPNCSYLCELDKKVQKWTCPKCTSENCTDCNTIHVGQTCKEYLKTKIATKDEKHIEELIKQKKVMRCLDCKTILQKTSGCNWISCPHCGIELCWINQTYRWGPKGPGDISAGCKCNVNGVYCHPDCRGCIPDTNRRHSRYDSLRLSTPQHDFDNFWNLFRPSIDVSLNTERVNIQDSIEERATRLGRRGISRRNRLPDSANPDIPEPSRR